jgi:hypothetical protein
MEATVTGERRAPEKVRCSKEREKSKRERDERPNTMAFWQSDYARRGIQKVGA